jgi:hypothetical protein
MAAFAGHTQVRPPCLPARLWERLGSLQCRHTPKPALLAVCQPCPCCCCFLLCCRWRRICAVPRASAWRRQICRAARPCTWQPAGGTTQVRRHFPTCWGFRCCWFKLCGMGRQLMNQGSWCQCSYAAPVSDVSLMQLLWSCGRGVPSSTPLTFMAGQVGSRSLACLLPCCADHICAARGCGFAALHVDAFLACLPACLPACLASLLCHLSSCIPACLLIGLP